MNTNTIKGYIYAILSAVIYGSMPLMSNYIYEDGVTPFTLVFLRNFFSLIPLALLALRENKTIKISFKQLPPILLISILGCCVTPILLFSSYQFIASGTATVFHFVYPAIVVIMEIIFFKKKAKIGNIISVILCAVGIGLFYSPGEAFNLTGGILALLSGLTFASYVVLLSAFKNRGVSGFLLCFWVVLISSVSSFFICIFTNNLILPSTISGWGLCVLFSLLVTTGAVSLFQRSAFLIGSERTSILSTLEPITSIIIGVIVFSEPFGLNIIVGSSLVVTASLLIAILDMRKSKKAR